MNNAYDIVGAFERRVAEFADAPYAVAVDSCTNALIIALLWQKRQHLVKGWELPMVHIPTNTYCSVPMAAVQAGLVVKFESRQWRGAYSLYPLPVVDSAKRFSRNMYSRGHLAGGFHCLSFHIRKPLAIGRGGMILHASPEFDRWARAVRHNGRLDGSTSKRAVMIGMDCWMTPPQAAQGLWLMDAMPADGFPDSPEEIYPPLDTQIPFRAADAEEAP